MVAGDDTPSVRLYRYPCLGRAVGKMYPGHAGHVGEVRFTRDERFVLSIGGEDLATLQWRYVQ